MLPLARAIRAMRVPMVLALIGGALPSASVAAPASQVQLRVALSVDPAERARVEEAAREALEQFSDWFTPYPHAELTIADGAEKASGQGRVIVLRTSWLTAPGSMQHEALVAAAIAREWWDGPLADGLAWYLQSHIVANLFDRRWQRRAYAVESKRYFGGFIPWSFRGLSVAREHFGLGRDAYVTDTPRLSYGSLDPATARVALGFGTLERVLGWPVLQRVLRVIAERPARQALDRASFAQIAGDAAGQDLNWFVYPMADAAGRFDRAIGELSSAKADCAGTPCYRTTLSPERRGNTGGRSIIRVSFADGQRVESHWDGHDSRAMVFDSPAPAIAADVDPDRTLLLDANYLNNRRTMAGTTNVPVAKWTARWLVWLQDTLLSCAFLF